MVETTYTQIALSPQQQSEKAQEQTRSVDTSQDGAQTQANADFKMFGDDGLSFWDFVDMINPLQHIPVVSTAYRAITGDEIDPASRMAGGTLYGGPIGLAASAFNVILEHGTGKDAGEHVIAWFDGDEAPTEAQPVYADNNQGAPSALASSFAPDLPASESDAFAAGEASLRMAELEAFMNPNLAKEVPLPAATVNTDQATNKGSASAGTWAAPKDLPSPASLFEEPVKKAVTPVPNTISAPETNTTANAATSPQYGGFQATTSHNDSLDALRAFARDVQAQRLQQQGQDIKKAQKPTSVAPTNPVQTNTSSLSQTQDNAWFADMMSRNMDQYTNTGPKG